MAWIVTSWRIDRLESLVSTQVRAGVERERRHAQRVSSRAARERDDLAAELEALERLGIELRAKLSDRETAPAEPPLRAVPASPRVDGSRRGGRARLRESPLAELFRATAG